MNENKVVIECPCCHGARELRSVDGMRVSFHVCTHCMGSGWIRTDNLKLDRNERLHEL